MVLDCLSHARAAREHAHSIGTCLQGTSEYHDTDRQMTEIMQKTVATKLAKVCIASILLTDKIFNKPFHSTARCHVGANNNKKIARAAREHAHSIGTCLQGTSEYHDTDRQMTEIMQKTVATKLAKVCIASILLTDKIFNKPFHSTARCHVGANNNKKIKISCRLQLRIYERVSVTSL